MVRRLAFLNAAVVVLWLQFLHYVHATAVTSAPYSLYDSRRWIWSLMLAGVISMASFVVGIPDMATSRADAVGRMMAAIAIGLGAVSVSQLLLGVALLPRFVIGVGVASLLPWAIIAWNIWSDGASRRASIDRVFAVTEPDLAADLRADLSFDGVAEVTLVGTGTTVELSAPAAATPLVDQAEALGATVVVLDGLAQATPKLVAQAATLHERGIRIRTLSLFYEQWLGKLPLADLERVALMFDIQEVHRRQYGRAKRLIDSAVAVALLPLLGIVGALAFIGTVCTDRGPLLYRQTRVGKDGEPFEILKFRTMVDRPSAGGSTDRAAWTTDADQRVTPVGALLRRSHLDELPQIINIFRGELSIVGPRPEQPAYVADLTDKLEFYPLRHLVRPGLTGWAQVNLGYTASEADAFQKLQYDFYYLRHQSLWQDLQVLARTTRLSVILGGR